MDMDEEDLRHQNKKGNTALFVSVSYKCFVWAKNIYKHFSQEYLKKRIKRPCLRLKNHSATLK